MSGNGWIKLYRKIKGNFLWQDKPFSKGQAWVDILLDVNHSKEKVLLGNETFNVGVGEKITSIRKLCKRWGWSNTKVKNFLELLSDEKMLEHKSDTKKTRLKVLNYSDYQQPNNKENDAKTLRRHIKNISKTYQKHTNKNVKNDKNDKNEKNNNKDRGVLELQGKNDAGNYIYPDDFEQIWKVYPRSKGKKSAWRKWKATRNRDVNNNVLLTAAKNYAQYCKDDKTEKKYIKLARTFFGPDEHWRDYLEYEKEVEQVEGMKVVY